MSRASIGGRPAATSHAEIEEVAFRLFSQNGFEATTLNAIAAEIGVAPRTVTRYYASKNDIAWGQFDRTLDNFRELLRATSPDAPLWERVHRAVVAFNDFPPDASPPHRERMRLILTTPTLQAHAVLRYKQWRSVIAEFVAQETNTSPDAPLPDLAGHISLALAMNAYERWLAANPSDGAAGSAALLSLLDQAMRDLRSYLA